MTEQFYKLAKLVNDYLIPGVMVLVAEKNEEILVLLRQLGKRLEDLEAHKHDHPLEKQRKKGISYQDLSKEKKKKRHAYAYQKYNTRRGNDSEAIQGQQGKVCE